MKLFFVEYPDTETYIFSILIHRNLLTQRSGHETRKGFHIRNPCTIWSRYVKTWSSRACMPRDKRSVVKFTFLLACQFYKLAPKTQPEKLKKLVKGVESSLHLNSVFQGFEFLKASLTITPLISQALDCMFLQGTLYFSQSFIKLSQGTKWSPGGPMSAFKKRVGDFQGQRGGRVMGEFHLPKRHLFLECASSI